MVIVYAINLKDLEPNIKSFDRRSKRSIGEKLIKYLVCKKCKVKSQDIRIKRDKYGKPYIEGIVNFYFNLSHSGKWIICAVSNKNVGVDISYNKKYSKKVLENFYSSVEIEIIRNEKKTLKKKVFHDLWAVKESHSKLVGKGLEDSRNLISLSQDELILLYKILNLKDKYYLKGLDFDNYYSLVICSESKYIYSKVNTLDAREIYWEGSYSAK